MKNNNNLMNLLEGIKKRKPLVMDLGDDVILHMKWDESRKLYQDEMGYTSMKLIQDILNNKVFIKGKKVEIREN